MDLIYSVWEVADVPNEIQHNTLTKTIYMYIFINQYFHKYAGNPYIRCCRYWYKQD